MNLSKRGSRNTSVFLVGSVLCLTVFGPILGQEDSGAEYIGSEMCASCHQEISEEFTHSVHSRLASFELSGGIPGCEACHGAGGNHMQTLDKADVFNYAEASIKQIESNCLSCHGQRVGQYWHFSEHGMAGTSCLSCHKIHQARPHLPEEPGFIERAAVDPGADLVAPPRRYSLAKPQPLLCQECHRNVSASMMLPSRHPVREGKMDCSACHQVQGSEVGSLNTEERASELCLKCHTEKQGPFVFDHPPVTESCLTCHVPHGSVAANLLKQNEPFLCLQCHEAHFHIGREGTSQPIQRPTGGSDNPFGASGWRVAFGKKCTQCHQAVHGTDLPSQSVPSQGKGLTR